MPRPRTNRNNEVRTRVSDDVYEGMLEFMRLRGISSESEALAILVENALFGLVGMNEKTRAVIGRSS